MGREKIPRAKSSCINSAMTDLAHLSLSATPASPERGLLKLPNEILLTIISYLRPTDNPVKYLKPLIFRPYCPFYADTSRSFNLRSLARTCRRLYLVTEVVRSNERSLERDTLKESRVMAYWLLDCQSGSRQDIANWLQSRPENWKPRRWGKEEEEAWALRKSLLRLRIEDTRDTV